MTQERTSIQYGDAVVIDQPNPQAARVVDGGLVRFQAPAAVPAPAHRQPFVGVKVHTGAVRITAGQEVDSTGFASHNMGTPVAAPAGASIASTLNSTYGPPSVEIPGFGRTSLAAAITMGYVKREGDRIVDVQQMQGEPALAQAPGDASATEDQAASAAAIDRVDQADYQRLADPISQDSWDHATAGAIGEFVSGRMDFEHASKALAASNGIEPTEALDIISEGVAYQERIVARAVAPLGLTGDRKDAFYEAVKADPRAMQDAMQRLVHFGDTGGFRELAETFIRRNPV